MKNEFANLQAMHPTVIGLLDNPLQKPAWKNQSPTKFTEKSLLLSQQVANLTTFIARQKAEFKGRAEQKDREESELEAVAHEIGQALVAFLEDNNREAEAAEIDLSLSAWRRLRDTALLAKATLLAAVFTAELSDYRDVIQSPSGGINWIKARRPVRPSRAGLHGCHSRQISGKNARGALLTAYAIPCALADRSRWGAGGRGAPLRKG